MSQLRLGLLGVGYLGNIHLRCALTTPMWSVEGFYDPDDARAAEVTAAMGIRRFRSYGELLRAVDAVDIVTPTPTHYALAARAIRSGKHVFLEKPATQTVQQGLRLLRLAQQHGVVVQVGHVERFNPAYLALKDMALRPLFIESHRLAAFQPRGAEVAVILDLMIHDLDLVLHLAQAPVRRVSASGVAVLSSTLDIANARVEFANGCVANLTASRISLKQMRKMRLFQPDAYISLDFLEKRAHVVRLFDDGDAHLPPYEQLLAWESPGRGKKWIHLCTPPAVPLNAIQAELEAFAHSIQSGCPPPVTLREGVEALRLAHRILRAAEQHRRRVAVP